MKFTDLDGQSADALRILAIDAITNANSGHPGLPLGTASIAYALWKDHLKFDSKRPDWFDRDRFVLSAGHGSSLLYALLHLFGYGLPLEELKRFRKLDSLTPGHPEYGRTAGVETTTGPLGQGFANAVGMAMAEQILARKFNRPELEIIDHKTYVLCGEGDLMEGLTYEAASLAGHLKLNKLVCLFDFNKITIEGSTDLAFTEDVEKRFKAQNWNVLKVENGNDQEEISRAVRKAGKSQDKPSLIIVKTHIGYKSPKQDSNKVHGEPLSPEEVLKTRENLGWPDKEPFSVPEPIRANFLVIASKKARERKRWEKRMEEYRTKYPSDYEKLGNFLKKTEEIKLETVFDQPMATREASYKVLNEAAEKIENLYGGSADLAPSTKTKIDKYPERNFHFGIREHAMGAISNGLALHGGLRPFCSTFLVFLDYMKTPVRLASMMKINPIYIFTHDSIAVGEDGPTHQPVEHIMSMRLIPELTVLRPADAFETKKAWEYILRTDKTVCLLLTRQKLPLLSAHRETIERDFEKGAYALVEKEKPDLILIGTGSETHIALEAAKRLNEKGVKTSVVSMPSWELFSKQPESYKEALLKKGVRKIVIEAGRSTGWSDLLGEKVGCFGVDSFGRSAPEKDVYNFFGLTGEAVAEKIIRQ
ncbi:MAG: transketolase [Elusimicrobia bacterium CG08_land_8_20_14_0_20_51_18]|nr:MAG: transketolase [Elusimicrobia bacterium CG08_land_8_20_14_0_20_51_18]